MEKTKTIYGSCNNCEDVTTLEKHGEKWLCYLCFREYQHPEEQSEMTHTDDEMPEAIYATTNDDENVHCDFVAHGIGDYFSWQCTKYVRADTTQAELSRLQDVNKTLLEALEKSRLTLIGHGWFIENTIIKIIDKAIAKARESAQ